MAACIFCGKQSKWRRTKPRTWRRSLDDKLEDCTCEFCETHDGDPVCFECQGVSCLTHYSGKLASGLNPHENILPRGFRDIGRILILFHSIFAEMWANGDDVFHPANVFLVVATAIECGEAALIYMSALYKYVNLTETEERFIRTIETYINWHLDGRIFSKSATVKKVCLLFDIPEEHPYVTTVISNIKELFFTAEDMEKYKTDESSKYTF